MKTAYLSLGSNISERERYIYNAIKKLTNHERLTLIKLSSLYETKPWGVVNQDMFINVVVQIKTTLDSEELLDVCQKIENDIGRVRDKRWGPRVIDVDILLYDDQFIESERLTIPHPYMTQRDFVIIPLAEIAPNIKIGSQCISHYVKQYDESSLIKL